MVMTPEERNSLETLVGSQFTLRRDRGDYVLERAGVPYIRIVNGRSIYDGEANFFKEAV